MCNLTRFLLIIFQKGLMWARLDFAVRHYLKLGWMPFLLLKYLLNIFLYIEQVLLWNSWGKAEHLGKEKEIHVVSVFSTGKNEMPAIHHVSSLEHDSWINPIE